MSLRAQAALDLVSILADTTGGFASPITVTTPDGVTAELTGLTTDIGQTINPETGQVVSGRQASVAIAMDALDSLNLGIPRGVSDSALKPWIVRFTDVRGVAQTYKVQEAMPDRALGIVRCTLETYRG